METSKIASYREYQEYLLRMQDEHAQRARYEKGCTISDKPFALPGVCYVCKKDVSFSVGYSYSYISNGALTPNWREHLLCPSCGLNNRMRASIHLFEQLLNPKPFTRIYILEQTTPLYQWLSKKYWDVTGSEYLGDTIALGKKNAQGIRNESITLLTFPDRFFDVILSFDVFEHISNFQKAFAECCRVLSLGGQLLFTVPFEPRSQKNIVRAIVKDAGIIEHLLPPEYHGDPINAEGCLAFYRFGWEMLDQLKQAGFAAACAHTYWSHEFGYLGDDQMVFIAKKG
ncbi:MAG: class I SAM-dependent methyltransferase [Dissulfurispiraceae bacterium]